MGLFTDVRALLTAPAELNRRVAMASPLAAPNHLASFLAPDWVPASVMTRAGALAIPAVARARLVITTTVARIPLAAYRGDTILTGTSRPMWIDRTDGPLSPYHRMLATVDDLLFYGWSAWALDRDTAGRVIAADHIPFTQWEVEADGTITWGAESAARRPVDPSSIALIPGSHGGILAEAATALTHARDLLAAASKAAETPAAYVDLHQTNDVPMSEADVKALIARWTAARRGENGGVAFTSSGVEARELGTFNEHLLVEGRNAAAVDIARALGVPAAIIDATTPTASLNYETREGRAAELIDYCLTAYMAPISARLGLDDISPRGTSIRFDTDAVFGPRVADVAPPDDNTGPSTNIEDPSTNVGSNGNG